MSAGAQPRELVAFLARLLCDHPDEVEVTEIDVDRTLVLELSVAQEDLGKVIGKQGRTVRAIRTVLSAATSGSNRRTILEVLD